MVRALAQVAVRGSAPYSILTWGNIMTINISYMGTKRQLAPHIAHMIADDREGPLLDIFSGISAVSSFIAPARPVWCNDAQLFASTVAKAFFVAPGMPPSTTATLALMKLDFNRNRAALAKRFRNALARERKALEVRGLLEVLEAQSAPNVQTSPKLNAERAALHRDPSAFPYRLFAITYAGGYFGFQQAIDIDSLRYAADELFRREMIDDDTHRWLCLALCQAMSKVATTTGHFAQYLSIKNNNLTRILAQRRRSVISEFSIALREFKPVNDKSLRKQNRVFRGDAIELLRRLNSRGRKRPSIIYADPPYSKDQYSRYYHVYETLLLYDYPEAAGTGRYRPDRFISPFSMKTKVESSIEEIISLSAQMQTKLVLSYPVGGLLPDAERSIRKMLRRHYGTRGQVKRLNHRHSSMGASKGVHQHEVQEMIFSAG